MHILISTLCWLFIYIYIYHKISSNFDEHSRRIKIDKRSLYFSNKESEYYRIRKQNFQAKFSSRKFLIRTILSSFKIKFTSNESSFHSAFLNPLWSLAQVHDGFSFQTIHTQSECSSTLFAFSSDRTVHPFARRLYTDRKRVLDRFDRYVYTIRIPVRKWSRWNV